MNADWKRRFTWVELPEIESAFLAEPFPARGHRGGLGGLKDSVARCGIIQPIIARVSCGRLQIICGYRRWLAAQVAGVQRVPVIVTKLSDADAEHLFAEENSWQRTGDADTRADVSDVASNRLAEDVRMADVEPTNRVESGLADDRQLRTDEIDELHPRLSTLFATVRRERTLRPAEVEALVDTILDLAPIAHGRDIREVGHAVAGADRPDDAVSWITSHSLRVAFLAEHMARKLNWSRDTTVTLTTAGLLHDVGMLLVPEDGLQSALPLSRTGQEMIRAHTMLGERLIRPLWSGTVADVALDHHERWDGTGYPAGKKGDAVRAPARLIGFLDAYAAMICKRVYRSSYPVCEAIRILRESTSIGLFDPAVERNFLTVFSSFPVGLRARLRDGLVIRVRRVGDSDDGKTHLVEIEDAPDAGLVGEYRWVSHQDLVASATEAEPDTVRARLSGSLAASIVDIP